MCDATFSISSFNIRTPIVQRSAPRVFQQGNQFVVVFISCGEYPCQLANLSTIVEYIYDAVKGGRSWSADQSLVQCWLADISRRQDRRMAMTSFLHDLRGGVRGLLKSPLSTFVAALTIALGIGVNTMMFSIVEAVLLRPLPYGAADRLVALNADFPGMSLTNVGAGDRRPVREIGCVRHGVGGLGLRREPDWWTTA